MGICSACTGLLLCIRPIFMEVFLLKNNTKKLLCILLAIAAAVCVIFACFMLTKHKQTDSASSAAASVSQFGSVADFDYEAFDYSDGLDENGYWSGIKALDYVTLPEDFGSIALKENDLTPTEDELQQQVDNLLNQYTSSQPVTGRAAQSGDVANIDYTGTVDGVAFTGGTATGYDLTLGSGSFIDGFEDQIIGHNVGDTFDVTVTFPDGYGDSTDAEGNTITLSGKEAVFSVTLNSISESVTPELTDEWVDSNFGTSDDLHTVDQLRSYFNDALYATNYENAIVDYLMSNSTFKELPSEITSYYIRMFLNYYNQYATAYGMDLNAFAQTQGYTDADAMLAASDAYFEHLAKQDLILQAVAETKSLAPTQEELDDAESTYADTYGENRAHLNALQSCVLDWLEENSTVKTQEPFRMPSASLWASIAEILFFIRAIPDRLRSIRYCIFHRRGRKEKQHLKAPALPVKKQLRKARRLFGAAN